ncbi:MAG: hypothetical protein ACK2U9_05370, partial [Anaerolineae bacterium]
AAKALKERYPDRTIVLGGVGAKAVERQVLERFDWIDMVAHGEAGRAAAVRDEALALTEKAEQVRGVAEAVAASAQAQVVARQREVAALRADRDEALDLAWEQRQLALIAWSRGCRADDPGLSILLALEAADIGHRGRLDPECRRLGMQELVDAMAGAGIPITIGVSAALPRAGATTAAWHAGNLLVARPEGGATVWDLAGGAVLDRIPASVGEIASVSWTPDGWAVTLARADGSAVLWDLESDKVSEASAPQPVPAPTQNREDGSELPENGGFAPLPEMIYLGPGDDDTLHVLNWPTLKAVCCARAGRNMTRDEWTAYMGEDASYRRTCSSFPLGNP